MTDPAPIPNPQPEITPPAQPIPQPELDPAGAPQEMPEQPDGDGGDFDRPGAA